jgi:hypothetical protein
MPGGDRPRKGRPGSGSGPGSGVGGRAPGSPGRTAFPTRDRGRGRSKPAARAGNAPGRSSGGRRLRWGEPGPSADRTRPGGVADGRRGSREPAGPPRLQTPLSWSRPLPRPHPPEARARLPQSPPLHSSPPRAPGSPGPASAATLRKRKAREPRHPTAAWRSCPARATSARYPSLSPSLGSHKGTGMARSGLRGSRSRYVSWEMLSTRVPKPSGTCSFPRFTAETCADHDVCQQGS